MQTDKKVTELIIDEERRLAWILFPGGIKSHIWESKEEAFDGICMHFAIGEINTEEFTLFFKQITKSTLPMIPGESEELISFILEDIPTEDLGKILFICNPTFNMCDCGSSERHGWIEDGDGGQLVRVTIQSDGIKVVEGMLRQRIINAAGAARLKKQIASADRLPRIKEVDAIFN